jgi:ribosomal protein S18 acetylase RimI-like enzyme
MKIELAQNHQAEKIHALLQACGTHMRENGIMQWNENYPLLTHVESDIKNGGMYCMMDDLNIAGIVVIDENQSPEYLDVDWTFHEEPILVVHRFAVHPSYQKAGIGKKLMDFALEHAVKNNYKNIRLDAYSGNERTQKFYLNRGYQKVGEIYFPFRTEHFNCYEKNLDSV